MIYLPSSLLTLLLMKNASVSFKLHFDVTDYEQHVYLIIDYEQGLKALKDYELEFVENRFYVLKIHYI